MGATLRSGDQASLPSPALIPLLLVCSSAGTVGHVNTFDRGANIAATLGGGTGADASYFILNYPGVGRIRTVGCAVTWSPAPSVTKVGAGPTLTCALAQGAPGCFDDHGIKFTVKTGGAGGAGATLEACYDGSTVLETINIPPESPAVIRGAVDITNGAVLTGYVGGSLTPHHLDYTAPAAKVLTFAAGSLAAATAGLKAATATVAAPVTLTASDLLAAGLTAILAHPRKLTFATAGVTASDAPASVTITGARYGVTLTETLNLGQTATTVSSVNAYDTITSLAYLTADGTGATIAIGYSDAFASATEIVTAFNNLAIAAPLAVRARAAQTSLGTFLETYSTALGVGVTETIDTVASTADTPLGFVVSVNDSATGAAATISPPYTGLVFTCPADTVYVAGTTYTAAPVGPRSSLQAKIDALTLAYASYSTAPWGFAVVTDPMDTASNMRTTNDTIAALLAGWFGSDRRPIYTTSVTSSPLHVPSAVRATNDAAIAVVDAAVLAALDGQSPNRDSIAVGGCYVRGNAALRGGSYHRPASWVWAAKRASADVIGADVADGLIDGVTLLGPGGEHARDDSWQSVKLGGGSGVGLSALVSTSSGDGFVKFDPGATRAGPASRLRYAGAVGVGLVVAFLVSPVIELTKGQRDLSDPITGQMSDAAKAARIKTVYQTIIGTLCPVGSKRGWNVSAPPVVEILDPLSGKWIDNGITRYRITWVPLGETESVSLDLVVVGALAKAALV